MNRWECQEPACKNTCVGVGGALGLRYIGWYYLKGHSMRGPTIYCPLHRPDGIPCTYEPDNQPCGTCQAEQAVKQLLPESYT